MKRECKFYKEVDNNWYIDLPEWERDRSALQMVYGADTLLDHMVGHKDKLKICFSDEPFEDANEMYWFAEGVMGDRDFGGGSYELSKYENKAYDLKLWLCDVTQFIFGEMPKIIYFKKVDDQLKIRISEIFELDRRSREINSYDLKNIVFLDDLDQEIIVDSKIRNDFRFTGLNNEDFINSGFYKKGYDKDEFFLD